MASIAKIDIRVTGLRKNYEDLSFNDFYRSEIKDDVEVAWSDFDVPHPYMKYECIGIMFIIAIRHPVANRLGRDRDDYATLIDILIAEVRKTIARLVLGAR